MDILLNVANGIYVISYLVTDILWLRVLSVVGGGLSMAWTLSQPQARFSWIFWTVVFNVINVAQIAILIYRRRPVRLTDDEQRLYSLAFRVLTPRELKQLVALGKWEEAGEGKRLVEQHASLDRVLVLAKGAVAIKVDGRTVSKLGEGSFIGEMSFLTGRPTTAAVDTVQPVRYLAWPKQQLEAFLKKNTDLRSALQLLISKDLVTKLAHTGEVS